MQRSLFEQAEDFGWHRNQQTDDARKREELVKLFPGLAQKNQRNKEEIDLFDDDSSQSEKSEQAYP